MVFLHNHQYQTPPKHIIPISNYMPMKVVQQGFHHYWVNHTSKGGVKIYTDMCSEIVPTICAKVRGHYQGDLQKSSEYIKIHHLKRGDFQLPSYFKINSQNQGFISGIRTHIPQEYNTLQYIGHQPTGYKKPLYHIKTYSIILSYQLSRGVLPWAEVRSRGY